MKRPGPVGLTMLAAFATVGVIEFRTVLAMLGFELTATVYFPVAALLVVAVLVGLLMLPDEEEPPGGDDGGPPEGKLTEAQTSEDPTSTQAGQRPSPGAVDDSS